MTDSCSNFFLEYTYTCKRKKETLQRGRNVKSCDLTLVSKIIDGLDYDDAVLCAGINNKLNKMYYAHEALYVLQGRGIYLSDELLDKLEIDYELISAKQLYELDESKLENILLIIPYMDIKKIKEMNSNIVQVIHAFSTFLIKERKDDEFTIVAEYDEGEHEDKIYLEDIEKLQSLKVKPLESACKIIYVKEKKVSKEQIEKAIIKQIQKLRKTDGYEDETGGWTVGRSFYKDTARVISENWNNGFGKIEKYMILQSIQNGSAFFYRKEYGNAIANKYKLDDAPFLKAGNIWRKISRILKASIMNGSELGDEIYKLLNSLEDIELNAFNELEEKLLCVSR